MKCFECQQESGDSMEMLECDLCDNRICHKEYCVSKHGWNCQIDTEMKRKIDELRL